MLSAAFVLGLAVAPMGGALAASLVMMPAPLPGFFLGAVASAAGL